MDADSRLRPESAEVHDYCLVAGGGHNVMLGNKHHRYHERYRADRYVPLLNLLRNELRDSASLPRLQGDLPEFEQEFIDDIANSSLGP
ncbi:MAG: hypothetical protein H7Y88_02070 [Phycisphaerales bacterium]|nr:hypothetical protein [Phycisphaerales bacterium]